MDKVGHFANALNVHWRVIQYTFGILYNHVTTTGNLRKPCVAFSLHA